MKLAKKDTLKFNDINKVWDNWKPKNEDIISITCGVAKSGAMYINSVVPENGLMTLRASSIPPTAKTTNNKAWENVKLLQLAKEHFFRLVGVLRSPHQGVYEAFPQCLFPWGFQAT